MRQKLFEKPRHDHSYIIDQWNRDPIGFPIFGWRRLTFAKQQMFTFSPSDAEEDSPSVNWRLNLVVTWKLGNIKGRVTPTKKN